MVVGIALPLHYVCGFATMGHLELIYWDAATRPVGTVLAPNEILLVTRGTARVQLGKQSFTAGPGGAVFIPQGTCVAVANAGPDTLTNTFVFSSPGFEQVLREVSSPAGAPPKSVSPTERAAAFHRGHAEVAPANC